MCPWSAVNRASEGSNRVARWMCWPSNCRSVGYISLITVLSSNERGWAVSFSGDGLDVAKFLVSQPIIRPILIHSSNSDRARMMQGEFDLAGWPCARVLPFGDDWVEVDWLPQAAALLKGPP